MSGHYGGSDHTVKKRRCVCDPVLTRAPCGRSLSVSDKFRRIDKNVINFALQYLTVSSEGIAGDTDPKALPIARGGAFFCLTPGDMSSKVKLHYRDEDSKMKTYQEAIKAAGTTRDIFKHKATGKFAHINEPRHGHLSFWKPCKPQDYLVTLAEFCERGYKIKQGDWLAHITGSVIRIENPNIYNAYGRGCTDMFFVDTADEDQFDPQVGDEVKTYIEGIGEIKTTVLRDGEITYVVQFENDWNTFTLDELSPVDEDYENGKALHDLYLSCFNEYGISQNFDKVESEIQKVWIEFAKLVKPVDVG